VAVFSLLFQELFDERRRGKTSVSSVSDACTPNDIKVGKFLLIRVDEINE
jgi:hypothetical protein